VPAKAVTVSIISIKMTFIMY